jgi:UMF1 family MFS transporter
MSAVSPARSNPPGQPGSPAARRSSGASEADAERTLRGGPPTTRLARVSWALFEWARNPYPILVVIYIFAPYFARVLVGDPVRGQALIGAGAAIAGLITAFSAPIVGAVADRLGRRKPWLGSILLWFAAPPPHSLGVVPVLVILGACSIAYEFSQVFHNAMLAGVAPASRVGSLSALALALGNLAGLLLMVAVLAASTTALGRGDGHLVERIVGPICGVWLALFSLPLFLFTPDEPSSGLGIVAAVRSGLAELFTTLRQLPRHRPAALFLLSRMVFNDGVVGILTFGGVYVAGVFHWPPATILVFGLITSGSAVVGGTLGGRLDDILGSKPTLILALGATILLWVVALSFQPDRIFYVIPVVPGHAVWNGPVFRTLPELLYLLNTQFFGVTLTVTISVSRSMLARLAPPAMMTQFFGLYALSGSATGFLAPTLVAAATALSGSQRGGVASLLLLLILGGALLFAAPGHRRPAGP